MYWIFHNGVTIDAVANQAQAITMAKDITSRHMSIRPAEVRFLPIIGK